MLSMNQLSTERRAAVVRSLVEGNSIRSTSRMTGVAKGSVLKLLADLGTFQTDPLSECLHIDARSWPIYHGKSVQGGTTDGSLQAGQEAHPAE